MASGTTVNTPSNEANIIQTAPGLPSVALQASGTTPYPQYGAQQLGISTSAAHKVQEKGPLERFFNAEPKVLGAIQILIGLIYIGFGAILFYCLSTYEYFPLSAIGGCTILGGIFFISSGSLCVAAANRPNRGLVKSSVGMNIASAVMALIDIILHMCEVIVNIAAFNPTDIRSVGFGLSVLLFFFSLLEFCITVSLAHFGCKATYRSDAQ